MRSYWVYMLASQPRGTLYIGVTNDILGRSAAHREGRGSRFTSRYGVRILVYFEEFADVKLAIQREKSLKRYLRQWKINPLWVDLYPSMKARHDIPSPGAG